MNIYLVVSITAHHEIIGAIISALGGSPGAYPMHTGGMSLMHRDWLLLLIHNNIQALFLSFASTLPVLVPWMTAFTKSNSFRSLPSLPILMRPIIVSLLRRIREIR